MQPVHALGRRALLDACVARQLDLEHAEERVTRHLVPHLDQPRVEVERARQRRDGDHRRLLHAQQRRDRLLPPPVSRAPYKLLKKRT